MPHSMNYSGLEVFKMLYKKSLNGNHLKVIIKFPKDEFFIFDELAFNSQ